MTNFIIYLFIYLLLFIQGGPHQPMAALQRGPVTNNSTCTLLTSVQFLEVIINLLPKCSFCNLLLVQSI